MVFINYFSEKGDFSIFRLLKALKKTEDPQALTMIMDKDLASDEMGRRTGGGVPGVCVVHNQYPANVNADPTR